MKFNLNSHEASQAFIGTRHGWTLRRSLHIPTWPSPRGVITRCWGENCFVAPPSRMILSGGDVHPRKIMMEPENEGLEYYFPFQTGDLQVPSQFSRVYRLLVILVDTQ